MRKASYDGDSTSITSGVENETKKSAMKSKKSSLKRRAPSFSQESDDTVIEPLLQRGKEKPEFQSAKSYGKGKTDSLQNKESDNKTNKTVTTEFCGTTESLLSFKDSESTKTTAGTVPPQHNYMNTNVFNTHDNAKINTTTKSKIMVEIDSTKQNSYTPSPLIFTTAKIHTDTKAKHMEPVQVTPAPILSTIEVSMSKGGNVTMNEKKISNGSSVINPVYSPMPLSKDKDENVTGSCFTTVTSPTMSKDSFSNGVTVTPSDKLSNVTTGHSSSIKISLPSTTINSLKSNNKKQGDIKDVKKEQTLPQLPRSLDDTKNNVTVKTIIPASQKTIDNSKISVETSQSDKAQIQKSGGYESVPIDTDSNSSQISTSNNKTPTSMNSVEISNIAKHMTSTVGNKQLQRQKTTTEDIIDLGSKADTGNGHLENLSAKHTSSTHPNVIDRISNIDELSDKSANNLQSAITKTTANPINKTTPILTTTKPNITSMATSNTVTTSVDDPNKPSITSTITNGGKSVSPNTIPAKAISIANAVSTASTICYTNDTNKDNTVKSTSNVSAECHEATAMQKQLQKSIIVTTPEKVPVANVSIAKTTGTASSAKSKTTKQSPAASATTASTISSKPLSNSTTKFADSKLTSVVTSVKMSTASPNTGIATKPSSKPATEISSAKLPISPSSVAGVNEPATITLIPKTLSSADARISTTSQSIISTQGNVHKPAITLSNAHATRKTDLVTASGKQSTVNSSVPASSVKSSNNNSTLVFGASKQSTTIPKTEPVKALSKTSVGTSNTNVTVSTFKSPQGTSATKANTKDSAASVKKPAVTKTSVASKSSVSSANKPVVETSAKTSTTDVSSALSSAAKKPAAAVSAKTSSVTTLAKTPVVSTSTKTPDGTTSNTISTSSAAIKPTTSATQVSANKSIGIAGSSVPSFTPALKQSELVKKGGPKSSENNKDGRVSKA